MKEGKTVWAGQPGQSLPGLRLPPAHPLRPRAAGSSGLIWLSVGRVQYLPVLGFHQTAQWQNNCPKCPCPGSPGLSQSLLGSLRATQQREQSLWKCLGPMRQGLLGSPRFLLETSLTAASG